MRTRVARIAAVGTFSMVACVTAEPSATTAVSTPDVADAAAPETTDANASAVARLSAIRVAAGAAALETETSLDRGCQHHVAYMRAVGKVLHAEEPEHAAFSPEGAASGPNALLASGMPSLDAAIEAWLAEPYHRVALLDPGVRIVGLAFESGWACLDVLSRYVPANGAPPVAYPPPEASGVPAHYSGGDTASLSPLPTGLVPPVGFILSLAFPPDRPVRGSAQATLRRLSDGIAVSVVTRGPADVGEPFATYQRNTVLVIPKAPLLAGTRYEVGVTALAGDVEASRSWQFTTAP